MGAAGNHPWFDSIGSVKAQLRPQHDNMATKDEAMECLRFEEEGLNGEDDDEVDSVDFFKGVDMYIRVVGSVHRPQAPTGWDL